MSRQHLCGHSIQDPSVPRGAVTHQERSEAALSIHPVRTSGGQLMSPHEVCAYCQDRDLDDIELWQDLTVDTGMWLKWAMRSGSLWGHDWRHHPEGNSELQIQS